MLIEWHFDLFVIYMPCHGNFLNLLPRYIADFYFIISDSDTLVHTTGLFLKIDEVF